MVILRLIYNVKSRRFHADKIFPAELSIMANLLYFESLFSHIDEPVYDIGIVYRGIIAQGKNAVISPAKKRYSIFIRLLVSRNNREKCVRDYNIDTLIGSFASSSSVQLYF